MARPPGPTVHVGKAAALIIVAVLLGVVVMRDTGFSGGGGTAVSADDVRDAIEDFTETTLAPDDEGDDNSPTTTAAPQLHAKNSVKVIAINATGTAGVAGRATTKLQQAGYNAVQPGNAPQKATTSLIYVVTPGYELDAQEIAALFGLPDSAVRALPNPPPSSDIKPTEHNIVVLVGPGITL